MTRGLCKDFSTRWRLSLIHIISFHSILLRCLIALPRLLGSLRLMRETCALDMFRLAAELTALVVVFLRATSYLNIGYLSQLWLSTLSCADFNLSLGLANGEEELSPVDKRIVTSSWSTK